ncbi:hypothetical protein CQA57_05720 [Helicobacter anseris]|uniref:Uncharacterized protein n=1 Tax=Helicobacter anseris TaxID=375926 RepID=A0A3D8J6B7_9HELI|nr:hypothetical protein [Helicobacter anseris]RDU73023.1 hypothetical protein CQA57_05720 [Helicobacter anseris]
MKNIFFTALLIGNILFASDENVIGMAEIKEAIGKLIEQQKKLQDKNEEIADLLNEFKKEKEKQDDEFRAFKSIFLKEKEKLISNNQKNQEAIKKLSNAIEKVQKELEKNADEIRDFGQKIPREIQNKIDNIRELEKTKIQEEKYSKDPQLKNEKEKIMLFNNDDTKEYFLERIRKLENQVFDLAEKQKNCECYIKSENDK